MADRTLRPPVGTVQGETRADCALVALHRDAGWTVAELRQLECVAAEIYLPSER